MFVSTHENTVGTANVSCRDSAYTGPKGRTVCTMCQSSTKTQYSKKNQRTDSWWWNSGIYYVTGSGRQATLCKDPKKENDITELDISSCTQNTPVKCNSKICKKYPTVSKHALKIKTSKNGDKNGFRCIRRFIEEGRHFWNSQLVINFNVRFNNVITSINSYVWFIKQSG